MPCLRCPMCRMKFNTSKTAGKVRCPECEELFEPDWGEAAAPEQESPRPRGKGERGESRRRPRDKSRFSGPVIVVMVVIGVLASLFGLVFLGLIVWYGSRDSAFKEFAPPRSGCSLLMPHEPAFEEDALFGMRLQSYSSNMPNRVYTVAWGEIPPGLTFTLRRAVEEIAIRVDGTIDVTNYQILDGNGYVEFEIRMRHKDDYASGRAIIVNGRYYHFYARGYNVRLTQRLIRRFIDSFKLTDGAFPWEGAGPPPANRDFAAPIAPPPIAPPPIAPPPLARPDPRNLNPPEPKGVATSREEILGVDFDPKKTDTAPAGSLLVGLEVGLAPFFDYNIVGTLKPIYRKGKADSAGEHYGMDEKNGVVKLLAKPGYAIGAITAKTGLGIDGVSVTFMRINGDRLDPNDFYESEWVGGMGGGGPRKLTGNGAPATGLIVREGKERVSAVGLIFK